MQEERCYPCSVHGRVCVLDEQWHTRPAQPWQRARQVPIVPYSRVESECPWYDVALWLRKEPMTFPEYVGYVEAAHPFAAVEQLMQYYRLRHVARASVRLLDGVQCYRAIEVWIALPGMGTDEQAASGAASKPPRSIYIGPGSGLDSAAS